MAYLLWELGRLVSHKYCIILGGLMEFYDMLRFYKNQSA